ncbi:hypothetical protein [Aeromonas veronii]|uniref:hypothetical protein n=1 Tax=Aeromonas veronii TaxID=654 RepID=UPI003B9F60B8
MKQHQVLQQVGDGDLSEVPLKQCRPPHAMRQSLTHTVLVIITKNKLVNFFGIHCFGEPDHCKNSKP